MRDEYRQAIFRQLATARRAVSQAAALAPKTLVVLIIMLTDVEGQAIEPNLAPDHVTVPIVLSPTASENHRNHRLPRERATPFDERIWNHISHPEDNCLRIDDEGTTAAQIKLKNAILSVRQSDIGAWLIEVAANRDVVVCVDHDTELEAHYRSYLRLLGLNSRLDAAGMVAFLAHELAHVPQHPRFSNNRRFSPFDMMLLQRVREAAAEAIATRVLWQLREGGDDAAWQAKLRTAYHDIVRSFEIGINKVSGPSAEREATRFAFFRWFDANWRLKTYDNLMISTLARIATDSIGIVPATRQLSDSFLRGVAQYGRESFLKVGDGNILIERFRHHGLSPQAHAELKAAIETGFPEKTNLSPEAIDNESLSAVSAASQRAK